MAETGVRRRPVVWPWIVGLTAAAVLVWLLAERLAREDAAAGDGPAERVQSRPVSPPSAPVHAA